MKNIKSTLSNKSKLTFAVFACAFIVLGGCKKATPFAKTNKYDRELEIERNYAYNMTSSIIYETDQTNGLLSLNEVIYYNITLTNTGTDPAPYAHVEFTTNYKGSGISNNQSAASPQSDIVNLAFLEPGFTTYPTYNPYKTPNGKTYSFRISNQAIPITSGTKITVYCHVYDYNDNEVFTGSFVTTLQ